MGEEQSLVPRNVDTTLQGIDPTDLTGGISATSGSASAAQVDKPIVSTPTGLPTIHGDGPVVSQCHTLYAPPAAATTALADDPRTSEEASVSCIIDIAFEEDTRLYGMHPANLEGEQALKLDKIMPRGYRYARDLQSNLVFIPPLNHPQNIPGSDFIIRKKGTHALTIVKPPAAPTRVTLRNGENKDGLSPAVDGLESPKQKVAVVSNDDQVPSFATAHHCVQHLSDQPTVSPASLVIAAINASAPSQSLEAPGYIPMPSPYQANHTQYYYGGHPTLHHTPHTAGVSGVEPSYFSAYPYPGQVQYFATSFEQTTTRDETQYNMLASFQNTPWAPYPANSCYGPF